MRVAGVAEFDEHSARSSKVGIGTIEPAGRIGMSNFVLLTRMRNRKLHFYGGRRPHGHYKCQDGAGRDHVGPGRVYARYVGVTAMSTRNFVVLELSDVIIPLTLAHTPGAPRPLSLAELRPAGILQRVHTDRGHYRT